MSDILSLDESELISHIAYRGDHIEEIRHAARDYNKHNRANYAKFIEAVGRNIYPLIIASDHEQDYSGVGTTFTLFMKNGSQMKESPAMGSNYELYKSCSHIFMGLGVVLGPYLENYGMCSKDDDATEKSSNEIRSNHTPWQPVLSSYVQKIKCIKQALTTAAEIEGGESTYEEEVDTVFGMPPTDMQDNLHAMLGSAITFCENCLTTGMLDLTAWKRLNDENFPRIKKNMKAAVSIQANRCISLLLKWKAMLGPELWRDVHVVIPTVWAVGQDNPRKEMMRQVLDADRVSTNIICSEWPRNPDEVRTLLGRIAGDRSIARLVFGTDNLDAKVKTHGLSTAIDVVQDDAMPAIWDAMKREGQTVRERESDIKLDTGSSKNVDRETSTTESNDEIGKCPMALVDDINK
eukprot:CAMPEP_0172515580 /NCGR_PEP_ID=MMETSP1066-20121228/269092_1 /TAXON_ID=671091 /ORGANISM="Coscinodiscus wailesii, Strain CCMP2513" /LENGTH=406 /DNA_ID=CAMNT_0013296691 /DNA_START=177 /DNA_END=1397 /DNA_ORIENTATION=-